MKLRGIHYVVLGTVVGLIAVFSIHRGIGRATQGEEKAISRVVVAKADIIPGTAISPELIQEIVWPEQIVPSHTARTSKQVAGRVLLVPLYKGEPVLLSKLAPKGTDAGLAGLLKEDMRAYTVRVDDVSGVAGFIHPGSHVDVLMSIPMPGSSGEQISKIILQNIKVLTTGQSWQQNASKKPEMVKTVNLEVTPEQSEILNLASTQGRVHLVLRSGTNKLIKRTSGVTTSYLINGIKRIHQDKPSARPRKKSIAVIKGMETTLAKF